MQFEPPLRRARFLKRYKRFFADVQVQNGTEWNTLVAHVPNTGSLMGCLHPGADCLITESTDPKRKLKATLHFLQTPTGWAGVNTSLPNELVYEAWTQGQIAAWKTYAYAKREVKISDVSRLDMVLAQDEEAFVNKKSLHHIEVKNVTLAEQAVSRFPDAKTERGRKHLQELMQLLDQGHTAEMVYVVQREGCTEFAPADDIDPEYGRLLRQAQQHGVKISAYGFKLDPESGVRLNTAEPLQLRF